MRNGSMPQEKDWQKFWSQEPAQRSGNASWSKKRITAILKKYVASGKKALDAGCGSGFFSAYFCSCGMKTTAIDYSDQALAMTQKATQGQAKTFKVNLLEKSLTSIISESFNLVFTDGLLEHFSNSEQDRILQNLKSVLTDDGLVINFAPNLWSPWELIRPFYMPGIKEVPFQLNQLVALNERNGLTVVKKGGINTIPFAYSPDKLFGSIFGMLLYTVAIKSTRNL